MRAPRIGARATRTRTWSLPALMKMTVHRTAIPEVLIVEHEPFRDDRGFLMEAFRAEEFANHASLGLPTGFVQLNHSRSVRNVTRGLHFQWDPPMGKYMRVARGEAFLVAVDIRPGSPTLGEHVSVVANDENHLALWAPACFGRGLASLSDIVDIEYLMTGQYNGAAEAGIAWNDPSLGIAWPVDDPITSPRDSAAPTLGEWLDKPEAQHFRYEDWS